MPAYFCVIILLSSVCVCICFCVFSVCFFVLNFILLVSIKYLVVKTVSTIVSD